MLAIQTINGIQPAVQPIKDGYSVIVSDFYGEDSGRTAETGTLIQHPIRLNVFKLSLKFKGISADISAVDDMISGNTTLTVSFLHKGVYAERNFYPSDRNFTDNGEISELSVNLIEI